MILPATPIGTVAKPAHRWRTRSGAGAIGDAPQSRWRCSRRRIHVASGWAGVRVGLMQSPLRKYQMGVDTLRLVPTGMTMMACADESMTQEGDFLSALKMTTRNRITGDTLELRGGDRVLATIDGETDVRRLATWERIGVDRSSSRASQRQVDLRVEDEKLLTGAATADHGTLPGQACVLFLRSPHPHAKQRHRHEGALATSAIIAIGTGDDLVRAGATAAVVGRVQEQRRSPTALAAPRPRRCTVRSAARRCRCWRIAE